MESTTRDPFAARRSVAVVVVVAACAASAGAHAGLVPQHLDHEPRIGVAFIAATVLLLVLAAALTYRPNPAGLGVAAVTFAALIAAYALNVTTGLPWLAGQPESVDAIAIATKTVEAIGLVVSIQLTTTLGGHSPLTHKEIIKQFPRRFR